MSKFMDRYNRMKEAGLVGGTSSDEIRGDSFSAGDSFTENESAAAKPGAFTERYNRYRQNRADGIRQSIEAWNEENKKLARSYGEHSGEFIKARSDALRTSGESLKQRIKDSGLYDDDTVSALGEGIDSWSTAWDDAYNEYVRKSTVGADRKKRPRTAEAEANSL